MVISCTAPVISQAEEMVELAQLSEEEKLEIHRDVYGDDRELPAEDAQDINDRLVRMQREIVTTTTSSEIIQDDERKEYLHALELVPKLVETESPSLAFLRCENYDPWAAGTRLCEYWKLRRLIFGDGKAFLPMTLSGAMKDDISTLRKGVVQLLQDRYERPVIFFDRSRCMKERIPRDVLLRVLFYVNHIASQSETAQRKGSVWLLNVRCLDVNNHFDRILVKRFFQIIQVVPCRYRACHLFSGYGPAAIQLVLPMLKKLGGKHFRMRVRIHSASNDEILQELRRFGIRDENEDDKDDEKRKAKPQKKKVKPEGNNLNHVAAIVDGSYLDHLSHVAAWLERAHCQVELQHKQLPLQG